MLTVSLLFSVVMLVSFDTLSTACMASGAWIGLSLIIFSGSMI
jgi:hypothetical protein